MAMGSIEIRVRILDMHTVTALIEALTADMPDDMRLDRLLDILADAKPQIVEDEVPDSMNAAREVTGALRRAARR